MKNFKKLTRNELKTIAGNSEKKTWIAVTKCGFTATTTQDWTPEQANAWVNEIEKNYCKKPIYSGSDVHHLVTNLN